MISRININTYILYTVQFISNKDINIYITEYKELIEILEDLKSPAEAIISKYYMERYQEQSMSDVTSRAQIVIMVRMIH